MDENSLASSLELYKSQLSQVQQALQAAGDNTELLQLQKDLQELVSLTEEGLLSLKKSNILQSLERNQKSDESDDYDAEYAAFQAAIAADDIESSDLPAHSSTSRSASNNLISGNPEKREQSDPYEQFQEIIGTRCRAPYVHDWGASSHYNAIITSIKKSESDDEMPKAVVMFCNPTHAGMLPCEYQLEGRCKFSDNSCRYSHGCAVDLEDLNEFIDPDYSLLKVGSSCLACYHDDLWYRATVVDVLDNHQFMVMFDNYDETATVDLKDILPLDAGGESDLTSDEDNAEDRQPISEPISDDESNALPVFLWRPPKTTQALGEWETHTKGIGSKLMAKMGYIVGQGLGKSGQGRAEPVPIQLIPQGKSLDKIMELKELAGDQDLFDVMKRQKKRKDKQNKKNENVSKPSSESHNVFDFINRKLGGKKGNVKDLIPRHHHDNKPNKQPNKNISEQELNTRSDRNLNVQILKTQEEIKSVEKELYRLKESLARNENKEKKLADKIRSKIKSTEEYLQKLRTSEQTIQNHKKKRSDHKKLTIF